MEAERAKRTAAWAGNVLAHAEHVLADIQPTWRPVYDDGGSILGCGIKGCVIRTHDPAVVIKITTDDTEAEFATILSPTLAAPICVTYFHVVDTGLRDANNHVFMVWREAAEGVGQLQFKLGDHDARLFAEQHWAGQDAYHALYTKQPWPLVEEYVEAWAKACRVLARSKKVGVELQLFGRGLVEVWDHQRILFGDLHDENVGFIGDRIVITDPGHVAVIGKSP